MTLAMISAVTALVSSAAFELPGCRDDRALGTVLWATAPVAAGVGIWATERASDGLDAGLRGLATVAATTALSSAGACFVMRSRADAEPRAARWWAGFLPVLAGLSAQAALGSTSPFEDHPWILVGSGLAGTFLWFGAAAFTPLGYSVPDADEVAAAATPRILPVVAAVRAGPAWTPALALRVAF